MCSLWLRRRWPRRPICRASAGRISPPRTACRTTTSSTSAWTETASGRPRKTAWGCTRTANGRVYRPKDGLAHRAVLYVAADKRTGDVWAATMGGLSRFSAGRFDTFTQLTSGLANDVVYGVSVEGDYVWAATAAGGSRLNTRTGEWRLFNERNTPMYEIWTYAVHATREQGLLRRVGRRGARIRRQDANAGRTTTTRTAKPSWCSTKTRA